MRGTIERLVASDSMLRHGGMSVKKSLRKLCTVCHGDVVVVWVGSNGAVFGFQLRGDERQSTGIGSPKARGLSRGALG